MILNKIEDPRDNLEKARRMELVRFAHANGQKDITNEMPASLIRDYLRRRGLTRITIPPRTLGPSSPQSDQNVPAVDAIADLERQYKTQQPEKRRPGRPRSEINVLRDECKRLGIRMDRRDRMPDLKAKIAQHGQNAAQRGQ